MAVERPAEALQFTLTQMGPEHLEAVLEIEQAGFSNPWRRRDFRYALAREGSFCQVALAEGRVAGYSVGFFVLNEFHLADFAVHPELQRQGVGGRLLTEVLELAKGREAYLVTLEVRVSNAAAIALYEKFGFRTVAIRRGYYSRPREDALVMLKPLKGKLSDWIGEAVPPASRW